MLYFIYNINYIYIYIYIYIQVLQSDNYIIELYSLEKYVYYEIYYL